MKSLLCSLKEQLGEEVAIEASGCQLSYTKLYDNACQLGNYLNQQHHQSILFCLYNSPELILCYLAGWLSGKTVIPVNPRLTEFELINVLEQFKPSILVCETSRVTSKLQQYCELNAYEVIDVDDNYSQTSKFWDILSEQMIDEPQGYDIDAKTIHLTSGTMGQHKAVVHSLFQITQYAKLRAEDFGYVNDDKLLIVTSLNHAFSFSYQLLPALAMGLSMVLLPAFDTKRIYQAIIKHGISSVGMLPTMSYLLSRYALELKNIEAHKLRYVIVAGDSLPAAFQQSFQQAFAVTIYLGAGMTELFGYTQNTITRNKQGSVGKALKGCSIKIVDNEIYLKSQAMMECYQELPELTADSMKNGWLATGDIGYLDDEDYLFFLGRKKQIIVTGGSKVSPCDVEQALYRNNNILQSCVVAKKDVLWGEVIWAFVVLIQAQEEVDIINCMKEYLADYKLPKKIIIMVELPQTSSGKIDRALLKSMAETTHD